MKKKKTFAQKFATEFEKVILSIVNDVLKENFKIFISQNTKKHSDGGYDGYLFIESSSNNYLTVLIEAKLRTMFKDLPLTDFSKSVIIAVNLDADYITIGTNVYFSANTINQLKLFESKTGLQIRTVDYIDIFKWINKSSTKCDCFDTTFINTLKTYSQKKPEVACRELSLIENKYNITNPIENFRVYGAKRKEIRSEMVESMSQSFGTYIIKGETGVGKKYLAKAVISKLKLTDKPKIKYISCEMDLCSITSKTDFILNIISLIWGCSCEDTIDFLNDISKSNRDKDDFSILPDESFESLVKLSNLLKNGVETDIFFTYLASLYEKTEKNKKVRRIFLLYNISKTIDINIYNIIITFIRKMSSKAIIILCIPNEPELFEKTHWKKFCLDLEQCKNKCVYELPEWKKDDAISFICDYVTDNDIKEKSDDIISYFGLNPERLSICLDLIKNDKLILSYIYSDNFNVGSSFDISKLKSAISFSIKKLSSFQLKIVFVMLLFGEKTSIKNISYALGVKSNYLKNIIEELPYFEITTDKCYWKSKIYLDLIKELENELLPLGCEIAFLKRLTHKFKRISISKTKKKEILLWIYIKLRNIKKIDELVNELIVKYKKNEQYSKIYTTVNWLMDFNLMPNSKCKSIYLRIEWLHSAIKIGRNGENSDLFEKFTALKCDIEVFCKNPNNKIEPVVLGGFYYVAALIYLSNSEYNTMLPCIKEGLKCLKYIDAEDSIKLQSELCGAYATALKHLENIESAVSYLQKNETIDFNPKIKHTPQYVISYHTHYASLFTGNNPRLALKEFEKINDICQGYSKELYLHNLHNIASMKFALKNYDGALTDSLIVKKETYENNFSIEFGRCLNIMGCIMWQKGEISNAKRSFLDSYSHFQKHRHNTHLWAPLVNLSSLCTQIGDDEAETFTKEAFEFIITYHLKQIKNSIIKKDVIPPKIVVAVLLLLYNIEQIGSESVEKFLSQIDDNRIIEIYNSSVKNQDFENLFNGSAYNCDGKIMLKV